MINSSGGYTEEQFKMAQEAVAGAGAVLQEISADFSSLASELGMSNLDIDAETSVDVSSSAQKATEEMTQIQQEIADANEEWLAANPNAAEADAPEMDIDVDFDELVEKYKKEILENQ